MPDIEVVIRKASGAAGALQTEEAQAPTGERSPSRKEKGKTDTTQKAINGAIIQVGKQVLSRGISQYGNLTGNYATQRTIDAITSIGADIATIAIAGPAGAILVAGKYAVDLASSLIDYNLKVREHDFQIRRLGDISTKGSRY